MDIEEKCQFLLYFLLPLERKPSPSSLKHKPLTFECREEYLDLLLSAQILFLEAGRIASNL